MNQDDSDTDQEPETFDSCSEIFELDEMEVDTSSDMDNSSFQQSLYDDVYTSTRQSQDYTLLRKALKSESRAAVDVAPLTIPYRFDIPTIILTGSDHDMFTDSSADEESKRNEDRPFRCDVEGCIKAYKNLGGLKYHSLNGHAKDSGDARRNLILEKPFECMVEDCGRRYKNVNGLKVTIFSLLYSPCSITPNTHITIFKVSNTPDFYVPYVVNSSKKSSVLSIKNHTCLNSCL